MDHEGAPEAGMLGCGWPALLRCGAESVTNYSDRALGRWAERISGWSRGDEPSAPVDAKLR
jgi:hypothetical protein